MVTAPFKIKRFRLLFAACWLIWMLLQALVLYWYQFDIKIAVLDSFISNTFLICTCILISNILSYFLPQQQRYRFVFILVSTLTLLWFLISRSILLLLTDNIADYQNYFSLSVPVRVVFGFLIIGGMALISILLYTLQDQEEIEKRKNEAEKLAKEAELYKLRQQLQPHFLFNSLNSINALIMSAPQQARTMIQQLSDFLRGTLKKDETQWITIQDELNHLLLYLEIEKARFGDRLSICIKKNVPEENLKLPALLLQPIVENAIKFGLYDTVDTICIEIKVTYDHQMLSIAVSNPFDPETSIPNKGTGFGLSSIKRRLYLLFNRTDLLQTVVKENLFVTTIKIPQQL